MSRPILPEGTITRGTIRTVDLMPAFIKALEEIHVYPVKHIYPCEDHDFEGDDECGECSLILNEELVSLMNDHVPEGFFLGSHPDEGTNFGVWPIEEDDN